MSTADWLGSVGVGLLLLAFALNLAGRMERQSRTYQVMNALGASLACAAAALIGFYPFVVLEGTWALVSLAALLRTSIRWR